MDTFHRSVTNLIIEHLELVGEPELLLGFRGTPPTVVLGRPGDLIARLLVESDRPNVWLHVADIPVSEAGRIPTDFAIADLLDHGGPRELGLAELLLAELVS